MYIMKTKIGVMGSATGAHSAELLAKAAAVGKAIAERDCILMFGATIGLPLAAAKAASEANCFVLGVSPAANEQEHFEKCHYPIEACNAVVFTGFGYSGRNVVLVRSCDAIIIIGGRIGTMNEFSVAYAEQRPIGILLESGGFAAKVREIEKEVLCKEKPTKIIYESSPEKLVEKLLLELKK